jgi:hypothetical protein
MLIFGLFFCLLFLGVGLAVGVGSSSPRFPPGVIAIIEGAPPGFRTVTMAELKQEIKQRARFAGLKGAPQRDEAEYLNLQNASMSSLLTVAWLQGEAEEMGISLTRKQVAETLTPSEEARLRRAYFTAKTVEERVRLQLLPQLIQQQLEERAPKPSAGEIRVYYEENPSVGNSLAGARGEIRKILEQQKQQFDLAFSRQWQQRTQCAPGFIVSEFCADFTPFAHEDSAPPACFEADPKTPVEACPAPVLESSPAEPGSVRPWNPKGDPAPQRPIPEGGA